MIKVQEYRGHIRNWESLCRELGIDTGLSREEREEQILVKAYETWGCHMADHMHGMFAFALWDDEEKELFCLRDQFGTKPFFYYETADGDLLYGTSIRQIMEQPGFVKELNEEMLQLYLTLTYVAGENTFFRGVKKLLPGRYLIWKNGKMKIERYWKPEFHPDESKSLEEWADEIHTTIQMIMPEVKAADETVTIGGMAKGSGMIHPNMCTMLAFITTDAAITKKALQRALSEDIKDTYNMISVDGDTSTNDTVLLLANGKAKNPKIHCGTPEYEQFAAALHVVNETLAKKMAGDGEGATALFEAKVTGAATKEQAKVLAKSIVCSNLTKAAIAGHDANWGRILCAMGYSGAQFDPEKVDLYIESAAGKIQLIEDGVALDYSEDEATKILSEPEVTATADIKEGTENATAWGCDLTHGYIDINADYRS